MTSNPVTKQKNQTAQLSSESTFELYDQKDLDRL